MGLIIQLFILIILCIFYLLDGYACISFSYLPITLSLVGLSFLSILKFRSKSTLSKRSFTVSFLFLFISLIVNFQISIDYLFNNPNLNFDLFFYDLNQLNSVILVSGIMVTSYNLGFSYSLSREKEICKKEVFNASSKVINAKPILFFAFVFFVLCLLTMNASYIKGGHGSVPLNSLSLSFYGLYWRLSIIYMSVIYYNNQFKKTFKIEKELSPLFLLMIGLSSLLFLLAHNRIYVIYLIVPLLMIFFLGRKLKMRLSFFLIIFIGVGLTSTMFKLFDLSSVLFDFTGTYKAISDITGNQALLSFSPFTAELASSVYANSVLYKLWKSGHFFWFATPVSNFFKILPGLLGFLISMFNIDVLELDTARYITEMVRSSYGLGTNCIGDCLINIGFVPSIFMFFFVGLFFAKSDLKVYNNHGVSLKWITIWLSIASLVVFIPRSSLFDLIGIIGFNVIFVSIYPKCKMFKK